MSSRLSSATETIFLPPSYSYPRLSYHDRSQFLLSRNVLGQLPKLHAKCDQGSESPVLHRAQNVLRVHAADGSRLQGQSLLSFHVRPHPQLDDAIQLLRHGAQSLATLATSGGEDEKSNSSAHTGGSQTLRLEVRLNVRFKIASIYRIKQALIYRSSNNFKNILLHN